MSASSGLRAVGRSSALLGRAAQAGKHQAQSSRSVGKLPVSPNKFVEDWATSREHLEQTYSFSGKNMTKFAVFGLGFPLFCYWGTVYDYDQADKYWGRPKKSLWGSPKEENA
eukprot:scaffold174139_cov46-Prasinocladus_malaysianus.AAC.1